MLLHGVDDLLAPAADLVRILPLEHHAEQRLFASSAEKWQSDLLDVATGTALLGSERVTRDAGNNVIEYAVSWSRPDLSVWVEMTS